MIHRAISKNETYYNRIFLSAYAFQYTDRHPVIFFSIPDINLVKKNVSLDVKPNSFLVQL